MPTPPDFDTYFQAAFSFPHPSIDLGRAVLDGAPHPVAVKLPLSVANRHGLIAGATGTGKTKTLQALVEGFSRAGVPVFVADVKGDLAGLSRPGTASPRVLDRAKSLGIDWAPWAAPTQFWSLTGAGGAQLRASMSSLGPVLLSRILDLNDTQSSVLSLVFKLCDDAGLLLLDLPDLRAALQWVTTPEAAEAVAQYGGLSKATIGVIQRKLVELETQGGERFLGEPELDIADLLVLDANGHGTVNLLDLTDVQRQPKLFSTAMLWLLAELYERLPERGDADRPVLAFFFDEAHLLFEDASKALLAQVEHVVRLIRSKGVGVYFVTQAPTDIPETVLGQLGNRIQHALRAYTPKDRKGIKLTAENFPESEHYDIAGQLTQLEIGDALCSLLNPRGAPSPTVVVRVAPPTTRMDVITPQERELLLTGAANVEKYAEAIDRESAREMLEAAYAEEEEAEPTAPPPPPPSPWNAPPQQQPSWDDPFGRWGQPPPPQPLPDVRRALAPRAPKAAAPKAPKAPRAPRATKAPAERNVLLDVLGSSAGKTLQRELVRGVFGLLKRR